MSISTRYLPVAIGMSFLGAVRGSKGHKEILSVYNLVRPHGYAMRLSDPWCAAFWSAIQIMAGNTQKEVPMSASCSQIIADAKALGIWQENENVKPEIGWGVLYDWQDSGYGDNQGSPDHIGIVYDVDSKYIYVLEGNKGSGVVGKRAVAINGRYLRGFVKPKYAEPKKVTYRPAKAFTGKLPTDDVTYGDKGTNALRVQMFLNWLDNAKLKEDKSCGILTTTAIIEYQATYGLQKDGIFGPKCREKAKTLIKKYPLPQPKTNGDLIGEKADELSYKTNTSEASYKKGKPTDAYKAELNKAYPDRKSWGAGAKAGASCDVFVGTVIRAAGIDSKFPRGLAEQIPYLAKSGKFEEVKVTASTVKDGDIIVYTKTGGGAHICIVYKGKIKEASHDMYYPKTTNYLKTRLSTKGKKMLKVYRAKGNTLIAEYPPSDSGVKAAGMTATIKIGQACSDADKKAGDSSGKEVRKSTFTYSSSSTSCYNWTYVFRPKDISKAEKAASMCEKAIANNNIGYSKNGETAYGKDKAMTKLAKAVNYDLSKITVKCGLSCGDLICLCNHYAGLSTCYIGSGLQLANNLKKNSNFECIPYKKGMELRRGDVLITAHSNGKNNHVAMVVEGVSPQSPIKEERKPEPTWQEKAVAWAKATAKDSTFHYKKWDSKDKKTQLCPICEKYPTGKYHGWNCIGFAFACWHHGGGLKSKCSCGVIANETWNKLLKTKTDSEANKLAASLVGVPCEVIRNGGKAIPLSKLKPADIISFYKGNEYYHTAFYEGDGLYAESTSSAKDEVRADVKLSETAKANLKLAIRHTGK